jgi:cell division protein FtsZ
MSPFSIRQSTEELGGVDMKNQKAENVKEVVERVKAPYVNLNAPKTLVIGCGGAGNNLVNYFHGLRQDGITTIGINTDEKHLKNIEADKKMFIGKTITRGGGAGGHKEIGQKAAELAADSLRDVIGNSDIVFLVAGLGGGTGLGATPVVGRIAKEEGAVVIGIGIMPFLAEATRRKKAQKGFAELKKVAESTILLDNNKLLEIAPGISANQGLNIMNRMISKVIISTRKTLVQTIMATQNLEISEILGDMQTNQVEEKEPQVVQNPSIVAPVPLHAGVGDSTPPGTPETELLENYPGDLL